MRVHRFEETWRAEDRRGFEIECSSGTYVRSLIADLGDAYCEQLRRTRIGSFDVADADPERVIALDVALEFIPEVRLDPARGAAPVTASRCRRPSATRWPPPSTPEAS